MVAYARDKDGLRRNNTVMNFQRRSAARLRSQPPRSMTAPELRPARVIIQSKQRVQGTAHE